MHSINFFAYLDAGTGSLIIQSLVGIFAGVALFARRYIFIIPAKLKALVKGDKKSTEEDK